MTALLPGTDRPGQHDPGGRSSSRVPAGVITDATFGGPGNCYRYRLLRRWGQGPLALVVMMNPSTADERANDPTVAKVSRMAQRWGDYGGLLVGNVFAYRATDQRRLAEVDDPVGPENDDHLMTMAKTSGLVVFAYGTPRVIRLRPRGPAVVQMMRHAGIKPYVLRVTATDIPWHPLYLPDATMPTLWSSTP